MAGIITGDSFTSPFVDCPRMFGGGRWSEPQTASGAMWGWCGYGNPYVNRRYAEDVLRREILRLADLRKAERDHVYRIRDMQWIPDHRCDRLLENIELQFQRSKENLYRQFDTYNRYPAVDHYVFDYMKYMNEAIAKMLNPPILMERKNMPENWSYAFTNSKSYIIIGSTGAAPKPAAHTTLSSAEAEANRLAEKHPGEEFTIYQTIKSYKVEEKPVTVKVYA